jgi:hypothetical protein
MFYVLDENHNLIEAYDKEGVLAVLAQAIADGSLSGISADAGFVSRLKCCVTGGTNQVAFVTQAKYNELKDGDSLVNNCLYIITDDTTTEDIDEILTELTNTVNSLLDGSQTVGKATTFTGMQVGNDEYLLINGNRSISVELEFGKLYLILVKMTEENASTDDKARNFTHLLWTGASNGDYSVTSYSTTSVAPNPSGNANYYKDEAWYYDSKTKILMCLGNEELVQANGVTKYKIRRKVQIKELGF